MDSGIARLTTFVCQIANFKIAKIVKEPPDPQDLTELLDEVPASDNSEGFDDQSGQSNLALVKECVDSLPARLRLVVQLVYYQGIPQVEVAKKLGVTPARVNQILGDAKSRIRSCMAAQAAAPANKQKKSEFLP